MMPAEAVRIEQVIERDGEVVLTGLPFKRGQRVEIVVTPDTAESVPRGRLTGRDFLESGLAGIWRDRDDIGDSSQFARALREAAQRRQH
jgi:hypothetical protein